MPYEDAIGLLAYCELENEQVERERQKHSGRQTQTARLKKRTKKGR